MMVLVLLFRFLVTHGPKLLRRPAEVLVWFVLLMFCMYSLAVFSYVVCGEPKLLPQRMQNLVYGGVSVVSADAASAIAAIPAGINQEDVTTTVFQGKTSKTIWQTRDSGDDVTQSEAQEFCVKFPPLKGNRWRLPTIAELEQRRSSEGKNGFNVDFLKLTSGALWSSDTHLIKPGDNLCNRPDMANQMNYKHAANVAVLMYYYFKTDTRQAPACDEYKTGARVLCVVDVVD